MPHFLSSDTILVDHGASSGLLPVHLLRHRPAQARAALAVSVCAILALAVIDWRIESLQLSILALVPLAVFAWFADKRVAYAASFVMAMVFTYFDYSGPQAVLVNLPMDTAFTVVSYVAVVAMVYAARSSVSSAVSLREQLAITSETATIQRWLADHDALTSASNRRAFRKALMQTGAAAGMHAGKVGIVLGDIDNFKAVNTRYGQRTGDRLLCTLFSRAQVACGSDAVIGRLDGDEFAVMFSNVNSDWELLQAASRLSKELRAPYLIDGAAIKLGMTLVTAMYPAESAEADGLLELAEAKLYQAKRYGRP